MKWLLVVGGCWSSVVGLLTSESLNTVGSNRRSWKYGATAVILNPKDSKNGTAPCKAINLKFC